jgi:hypothetical protein
MPLADALERDLLWMARFDIQDQATLRGHSHEHRGTAR